MYEVDFETPTCECSPFSSLPSIKPANSGA